MTVVAVAQQTLLDHLVKSLEEAADYNADSFSAPVAVVWTDEHREFEELVSLLRERTPILTFGDYDPLALTGPAEWIRCAVADTVPWERPSDAVPVVYLPGVSRAQLRAVEECPPALRTLAELVFRGVYFTQRNMNDWTLVGYLRNVEQGVGVEVAAPNAAETRDAVRRAICQLAVEPLERLRAQAPLRASDFDRLLNPDPVRQLARWMNEPDMLVEEMDAGAWAAFVASCKRDFGFDPDKDGVLSAAELLGARQGEWARVWETFGDAPKSFPGIVQLLEQAQPLELVRDTPSSWPQENRTAENNLRKELAALSDKHADEIRVVLDRLWSEHAERRGWVWAKLEQAPLAEALAQIRQLAGATAAPLPADTPSAIADAYTTSGWLADAALLAALAAVDSDADVAAVEAVVDGLYRPWAETSARRLQDAMVEAAASGALPKPYDSSTVDPGTCLVFVDGLRYDLARQLETEFLRRGLVASTEHAFAAIPTVTPTAKPAVSPAAAALGAGAEFGCKVMATGAVQNANVLRQLVAAMGFEVLEGKATGAPAPTARGWAEAGEIDALGHGFSERLSREVGRCLDEIADRVSALLDAGWQSVRIVTDHGWLLLPGGLPKVELPQHLTVKRKGRCARLNADAPVDVPVLPWFWDSEVRIAIAPGVSCFEAGTKYEHGGISAQESVIPVVSVTRAETVTPVVISELRWVQLRVRVHVDDAPSGALLDVRSRPGDASSSLVAKPSSIGDDGNASVVVDDDSRLGESAAVVVTSADAKRVLAQRATIVGGDT
jgi:hypothetical protein